MSTNYYVDIDIGGGRTEHVHLGLNGTILRGYRTTDDAPVGVIESWADWKAVLATIPHQVVDEYGREMTDDELVAVFEGTSHAVRRWQYDWVNSWQNDWPPLADDYSLDPEHYTVCFREFC